MIIDKLENSHLYSLGSRFTLAFEFLQNTDLNLLSPGRYEIAGTDVFALVSEYKTAEKELVKWEAHRLYADIQVVITGSEKMGFGTLEDMQIDTPYVSEKDIVFFYGTGDYVTVKPKSFVVFFPHDAHQPGISSEFSLPVKKAVIKVRVES